MTFTSWRSTLYFLSAGVAAPLPVTMKWMTLPKQRFSHSHLFHAVSLRLKLSGIRLISEIGQHIKILGLASFRGGSGCLRRGRGVLHWIIGRFVDRYLIQLKRMIPPLIMPFSVLNQINLYRNTLRSNIPTADADFHLDHSQIPPNGWSSDEQGSSNPRQGRLGDAGGPTASGETSATSSPTLNGDDGGEKAAREEQEQFVFKASHDLLVLEGVDEDAEGADSTMRDELIMMARDDPMWMAELRKYLQKEEKEREQVQKECAVRLARWREGIFVQPT
ncbi:hypothetical protein L208DRAFT_1398526 [Tricholoma matsutake]|nr:hypothetical protein L208DRAFT_1398526 [Tricholoma matsutake 945]